MMSRSLCNSVAFSAGANNFSLSEPANPNGPEEVVVDSLDNSDREFSQSLQALRPRRFGYFFWRAPLLGSVEREETEERKRQARSGGLIPMLTNAR